MARILALFTLLASLFIAAPAMAAGTADFSSLLPPEQVLVAQVIDPLRLRLADGRVVQLAGIEIPDLDPLEPGENAAAALAALKPLLENRQARLYLTRDSRKGRINRMGHTLAHVQTGGETPIWVQGYLLAAGHARLRAPASNPEMNDAMAAIEAAARAENMGIWADPAYAVRGPDNAGELIGRYGIVEGTVRAVGVQNNVIYLNFGADWRTDFTIGLESDARRALMRTGIDPQQLGGRRVRVRGWVENYNGPYIRLNDIMTLTFIDEPTQEPTP